MKKHILQSIGALVAALLFNGNIIGQQLQTSMFDDVNKVMLSATTAQADVLSPKTYREGMEAYREAMDDYRKDGELSEIKENISTAFNKFSESIENSKVSAVMFSGALSARNDAINAEAGQFSKRMWTEAEEEMKQAAVELEKGDADDAKEKAKSASELYRKAELESIKANYLTRAKELLEKADDEKAYKSAPKTFNEAKLLINNAEKALAENRYDTDEARHLAKEAEYKASLAMHIAKQKKSLDELDYETEDYLLMMYKPISTIGEGLGIDMKFDQGVDAPVTQIMASINKDEARMVNLEGDLYESRAKNNILSEMLSEQRKIQEAMEGQQSQDAQAAMKKQQALQAKIDRAEDIDAKFDQIQRIFTQDEAQVFRQKDDVIIRLTGVNFDVGKAQIKQEDYAVLAKLERAVKIFKNADIVIEGHTDSQGSDDANLNLSLERADAVLSYMKANIDIDSSHFSTTGFGESKPLANNETATGRAQNRRIDIVIRPMSWETLTSYIKLDDD